MNTFKEVNDIENIGMIKLDNKVYTLKMLYEMKDIVVEGDVDLYNMSLTKLPNFKSVGGDFYCNNNKLTSLEGCPIYVGGSFHCSHNQLTSLKYCPTKIGGDLWCKANKVKLSRPEGVEIGGEFIN
jgi:hypothetical protein